MLFKLIICIITFNIFNLFVYVNKYYKNKMIKRWSNACQLERDLYQQKYGYLPPI